MHAHILPLYVRFDVVRAVGGDGSVGPRGVDTTGEELKFSDGDS